MSYFEPNPAKADSVAADDVRETESSLPAEPEEPSERADSLSIFPSEGSESEGTDPSSPDPADVTSRAPASEEQTVAGTRNPRTRLWYSVLVGIADDCAKLEAKLGTFVETVATLQAVCTGIEKRLGQVEDALARTEGLSARIAARLTETQDALQHIESVGASGPSAEPLALQALGANIDTRLAHVEEALGRTEGLVADRTLHDVSAHIAARLTETEGAVRRIEGLVASGPPEELFALQALGANIDKRLTHVEEALGRTEALVTDRTLHEVSAHIAARLTETEGAVRRIESVVASGPPEELFALQTLSANIDKRLAHVEETLGRTEALVTDRTLHVTSAHIVARLTETEGAVRRIESLVASGAVAELSARVDAAFAHTDDALRRIEAALESKSDVPSINRGAVVREEEEPSQVVSTPVERQTRPASVAALAPPRPSQAPWRLNPSIVVHKLPGAERIARLATVIVVLVGVLIRCRSNASSHRRRNNTTPAPTRRTTARRDGRRTGAARAGLTGKTRPTHKSVDTADDTWSFRTGTEAPRRCRDNGGRDCSFRRACPICRGSFDYLDTTRREGISQRAGGGRHTPDPSRATSRVGCGTDRQRRIRTVVRLRSDTCRTGHEHRSDAAGQSSVVTSNGDLAEYLKSHPISLFQGYFSTTVRFAPRYAAAYP